MIIVVGKNKANSIFNICKVDSNIQIMQIELDKLHEIALKGKCENYRVDNDVLNYTQGSESNIPNLESGGLFVIERIVKDRNKYYKILDTYNATIRTLSEMDTIKLKRKYNIVNAKVTTVDSKEVIASLGGKFREVSINKDEAKKQCEVDTSSIRIADIKKKYLNMGATELIQEYTPSNKISYIESRAKNGKFSNKIAKALAIGLIVFSTAGMMQGCGSLTVRTEYNIPIESKYTTNDIENILTNATSIKMDSYTATKQKWISIIVDKEILGCTTGEFNAPNDDVEIQDNFHNSLIKQTKVTKDGEDYIEILDRDANCMYNLKENDDKTYSILDTGGKQLAKLTGGSSEYEYAVVSDNNGSIIASLKGNDKDSYSDISIIQKDKLDTKALILIMSNYAKTITHKNWGIVYKSRPTGVHSVGHR